MTAKKKSSIHSMWQIENMVQKQLQDALSGNFFQSIFNMRETQIQHAKQFQEQMKDWQGYSFWDMPEQMENQNKPGESVFTGDKNSDGKENDTDILEMGQLADGLQKNIQSFVNHVLNKSGSSKETEQ